MIPESLLQGALTELGRMIPEVTVVPELQDKTLGPVLNISFKNEKNSLNRFQKLQGLYDLHISLQMLDEKTFRNESSTDTVKK